MSTDVNNFQEEISIVLISSFSVSSINFGKSVVLVSSALIMSKFVFRKVINERFLFHLQINASPIFLIPNFSHLILSLSIIPAFHFFISVFSLILLPLSLYFVVAGFSYWNFYTFDIFLLLCLSFFLPLSLLFPGVYSCIFSSFDPFYCRWFE